MAIYLGNSVVDRAQAGSSTWTTVDTNNPCNGDGTITQVNAWLYNDGTVYVGIFYPVGDGIFRCRSAANLGFHAAGYHEFTGLELDAKLNDVIGYCIDGGQMEQSSTGGTYGAWQKAGNYCVVDGYFAGSWYAGHQSSISGDGTDYVTPPNEEEIHDQLDYIYTNYIEGIRSWLRENYGFLSYFDIQMAVILWGIQEAGGGGTQCEGVTLTELQTEIAALSDHIDEAFSTQTAAIIGLYDALVLEHGATRTALGVTEGNLDAAITVAKGSIEDKIDALDFTTDSDLAAAVAAIEAATAVEVGVGVAAVGTALAAQTLEINAATAASVAAGVGTIEAALTAVETSLATAIGNVVTAVNNAKADILQAIAALLLPKQYPGDDDVTLGTAVNVYGEDIVSAQTYGVGGRMDGIRLSLLSVPGTKGKQSVEGFDNWKYLGWIVFRSDDGMADELQWLGPEKRVYLPKHLTSPADVVVFMRDGASCQIRPFIIT